MKWQTYETNHTSYNKIQNFTYYLIYLSNRKVFMISDHVLANPLHVSTHSIKASRANSIE